MAALKNIFGLVFQVILVIAAVLVFSYFDPFGILSPTSLKLKNTPVTVESIREIGELITAEYYGEVVTSYKGRLLEISENELDTIEFRFSTYQEDLQEFFVSVKASDKNIRKNSLFDRFKSEYPELLNDSYFQSYINYIQKQKSFKEKDLDKRLNQNQIKNLLNNLYKGKIKFPDVSNFTTTYNSVMSNRINKEAKKKQLVVLGRGWVKAGFRFNEFTNDNFKYDESRNTIHLVGLKAEVLSQTINPWFSPDRGIPGFEILIAKRKAKSSDEALKVLKQDCLNQLIANAHKAHILEQARTNAINTLSDLFSLLMGKDVTVIIHENSFDFAQDFLSSDNTFNPNEYSILDSSLKQIIINNPDNSVIKCRELIYNIEESSTKNTLKRFSGVPFELSSDGILSVNEIEFLLGLKEVISGEKSDFTYTSETSIEFDSIKYNGLSRIEYLRNNINKLDLIWYQDSIETYVYDYLAEKYFLNNDRVADTTLQKYIDSESNDLETIVLEVINRLKEQRIKDYSEMIKNFDTINLKLQLANNKQVQTVENNTSLFSTLKVQSDVEVNYSEYEVRFLYSEISEMLIEWAEIELEYNNDNLDQIEISESDLNDTEKATLEKDQLEKSIVEEVHDENTKDEKSNFSNWVDNVFNSNKKSDRKKEKAIRRAERRKNKKLRKDK